jgi:hypothetical protein
MHSLIEKAGAPGAPSRDNARFVQALRALL